MKMGLFFKKSKVHRVSPQLVNLVRALDDGEEWAQQKITELWDNDEPNLMVDMSAARIEIYQAAAKKGDKKAQLWMGKSLEFFDKEESEKWLIQLSNEGNIEAMKALAGAYNEWTIYGKDEEKQFYWHMKAAEAGDADAQYRIGLEYSIQKDYENSFKWYQLSANQKYPQGLIGLAECYERLKRDVFINNEDKRKLEEYDIKIENLLIDAMNYANNQDDSERAASSLGFFYRSQLMENPEDINTAKRSAYFMYVAYLCGNPYMLDHFNELVDKKRLYVNTNDIEKWAVEEQLFN
ncbi:MAG: tetratricopeptide repeat protein [Anaerostipes sp.]